MLRNYLTLFVSLCLSLSHPHTHTHFNFFLSLSPTRMMCAAGTRIASSSSMIKQKEESCSNKDHIAVICDYHSKIELRLKLQDACLVH